MHGRRLWHAVLVIALLASACGDDRGAQAEMVGDEGVETPTPPEVEERPQPVNCDDGAPMVNPSPGRLLTRVEYDNTVRDLLGIETTVAVESFPPENRVGAFENNARAHVVNPLLLQQYMEASEGLADAAVAERLTELLPCSLEEEGEAACGAAFVEVFVRRAFRRPATDEELNIFLGLFETIHESKGFDEAVSLVIQATLQSPQFLYRLELSGEWREPEEGEAVLVDSYAMASRLSYFLWSSMPDDALLDVAAQGGLSTPEDIESQARRLLMDPRASASIRNFHRQWLGLDNLESLVKDAEVYPGYEGTMPEDWRVSVDAFIDHVFWDLEKPTVEALLTDPTMYLTPELAALYGIDMGDVGPAALVEVKADPTQRAGLLTQPGVMAKLANPDQASPIRRGVFVREHVLCQELPEPPANIEIMPPDPNPNATTRERFAAHTAEQQCADCHVLIDPLGFGFENYDGVGRWRSEENGLFVDSSGEVVGSGESLLDGPFDGAVELSYKLADSELVQDCIAEQWFTYANGRLPAGRDACALDDVQERFRAAGGDIREMMVAVVLSDAFRYRVGQGVGESNEEVSP